MPTAQLNPEWDIQLNEPLFPSADEKLYVLLEPTLWSDWEETLSEGESVPLLLTLDSQPWGMGRYWRRLSVNKHSKALKAT